MASPFATEFRFSRFDPLASGARGPAPVPTGAPVAAGALVPAGVPVPAGVANLHNDA